MYITPMKKTAYLSIDMDFWDKPENAFECLHNLLQSLYISNNKMWEQDSSPIIAVMNHQQLLPHVKNRQSDILINIDKHSDICAEKNLNDLNCGSWVSYIKWRRTSDYLWVRQHSVWMGNCNGYDLMTGSERYWNKGHGWYSAKTIKKNDKIDICDLVKKYQLTGVGLCMSPDYIGHPELEKIFKTIVRLYEIPYFKGRKAENYGRKVKPPKAL